MRTKTLLSLITILLLTNFSCSKKEKIDQPAECKTCKALANASAGLPEVSKQICSDAAMEAFRNEYSRQEITCR